MSVKVSSLLKRKMDLTRELAQIDEQIESAYVALGWIHGLPCRIDDFNDNELKRLVRKRWIVIDGDMAVVGPEIPEW